MEGVVDVGHLRRGKKPIYVRKPEFGEAYPEASMREGGDELTLRADVVGTLKDQCRAHRKASQEKKENLFQMFRQIEGEVLIANQARWDVQLKGLVELERRCQSFRADVEYLCEREEVLKDLVLSKKDMQRTAPPDCQRNIHEELKGVGGAEGKRSFGTRANEAQVDEV